MRFLSQMSSTWVNSFSASMLRQPWFGRPGAAGRGRSATMIGNGRRQRR
jgi:hypothetical protein